jgi:hypothetical protein
LASFFAYDSAFSGGVFVAAADVNGDGKADIITGAGAGGGPNVKVFSGADGVELFSFFAYGSGFAGGVSVAAGDVNGDGTPDIITGAGPGGGPHVKVFSGKDLTVLDSFFAYGSGFTGGVWVGAGDVNGDGKADIITGAGAGGGPHVKLFDGASMNVLQSFFAFGGDFTGGVRVAILDANGSANLELGAGPGGGPRVEILDAQTLATVDNFFAYDPNFHGGVFVGGTN